MKLALIGYGKMGKAIEEIAVQRGHEVVLAISRSNLTEFTAANLQQADVAIEFTSPHSALSHVTKCLQAGVSVVCGTTGWTGKLDEAKRAAESTKTGFVYASNFSVGVNIFFELNKKLADLMSNQEEYDVALREIHHTQKKDAPSGTAITLAEQILSAVKRKKQWINETSERTEDLEIISERTDPAPGTHHVTYSSPIDTIEIIHTAHSRKGFAAGAVLAAEFIKGKQGYFTMNDVLQL
jgi:4-hydroxy-tetrahydrodipicolinate reductase